MRSENILNEGALLEQEQEADLARPELAWWHEGPSEAEIEEMARRWEEDRWGRLVVQSDAEEKGEVWQ